MAAKNEPLEKIFQKMVESAMQEATRRGGTCLAFMEYVKANEYEIDKGKNVMTRERAMRTMHVLVTGNMFDIEKLDFSLPVVYLRRGRGRRK